MESTEVQVGRTLHLGTPDNPHPGFPHPPSAIKNNSMNTNWETGVQVGRSHCLVTPGYPFLPLTV